MTVFRSLRLPMAALLFLPVAAATASTTLVTFDTPTASNAQTQATYGLAINGANATAAGGVLNVQLTSVTGNAVIGSFVGDVTLDVDVGFTGLAGSFGMGVAIGSNRFIFHPGFLDGAFRVDGPGGFGNSSMGFTPTQAALNHMRIAVDAETGQVAVRVVDGVDASKVFQTVFTVSGYVPGSTTFALTANGSGTGQFDNLAITTVPEPGAGLLLAMGLATLLRRRSADIRS